MNDAPEFENEKYVPAGKRTGLLLVLGSSAATFIAAVIVVFLVSGIVDPTMLDDRIASDGQDLQNFSTAAGFAK